MVLLVLVLPVLVSLMLPNDDGGVVTTAHRFDAANASNQRCISAPDSARKATVPYPGVVNVKWSSLRSSSWHVDVDVDVVVVVVVLLLRRPIGN